MSNQHNQHEIALTTNANAHVIDIPPRASGYGSSANGGELLFLALASCYCNDLYREAAQTQDHRSSACEVKVDGTFADAPGSVAENITYSALVEAEAGEAEIEALMRYTDTVAEIHNTLRLGTTVTLTDIRAISVMVESSRCDLHQSLLDLECTLSCRVDRCRLRFPNTRGVSPMRIGLQVISFNWAGSPQNIGAKLGEIARAADDAGFYSLWVMDHFFQMQGYSDPHDPMLEGYTAQGFMAAQTKRIKHGLMVTGGFYRYPGILIKTVTTLDVLSGGRAYFGIGAGWYEREAHGLGVPFPPTGERMARLEEILQIAHKMWSDDEIALRGQVLSTCRADHPPAAGEPAAPADPDRRRW